ncbi:MAG: DUF1080 domain-containing protein [Phycisphaerales bacterium]
MRSNPSRLVFATTAAFGLAALIALPAALAQPESGHPAIVKSGNEHHAPSDAIVLFDGSDLSMWRHTDGRDSEWTIEGDAMVVKPGSGSTVSTEKFNDAQIHLEFATPNEVDGSGQGRGNSGMYLQGRYEVQILDSYENETYPDGQCGAIYGQQPPLVNASRGPGEWQSYDVIFRAARFDESGKRVKPATVTVFHNGVLIHDHVELEGPTGGSLSPESNMPGPLYLQDHGNLTRFRNIWIRPL